MKKISLYLLIGVSLFLFTGCQSQNILEEEKVPVNLKEVVGDIVPATLNQDGNIVINKNDVTNTVMNISYDVDGVIVGLLAVRDSFGNIKVVVNTCQSCGGAPYAYFVQVDDKIQCQNCGNIFAIDELDNLDEDGCNPIGIVDRKDTDTEIIIGVDQLKDLKERFVNWKGPRI